MARQITEVEQILLGQFETFIHSLEEEDTKNAVELFRAYLLKGSLPDQYKTHIEDPSKFSASSPLVMMFLGFLGGVDVGLDLSAIITGIEKKARA